MNWDFFVLKGSIKDQRYKDEFSVETILFIVLTGVKGILEHQTKSPPQQLIRHKFLAFEFSKSSQI